MKKFLYLLSAILFSACGNELPVVTNNDKNEILLDTCYRSEVEAINIAKKYLTEKNTSRNVNRRVSTQVTYIYSKMNSRNSSPDEYPLIYAIDFENDNGYMLVPSNRQAEEILAVIDRGQYNDRFESNNPGFEFFMNCAEDYLSSLPADNPRGRSDLGDISTIKQQMQKTVVTTHDYIAPRVVCDRGQYWPEGSLCPNRISGCGPTALFMICEYFMSPSSIYISYDKSNIYHGFDWSKMRQAVSSDEKLKYGNITKLEYQNEYQIALLAREIGERSHANYAEHDKTSTAIENVRSTALKLLNDLHVTTIRDYSFNNVTSQLDQGALIYMRGSSEEGRGGHAWVVDGYERKYWTVYFYEKPVNKDVWEMVDEKHCSLETISINWGWNGSQNGVFSQNAFNYHYYDDNNEKQYDRFSKDVRFFAVRKE